MALSNFEVFTEFGYKAFVNTLQQNIDLWNGATNGALMLKTMAFSGDVYEKAAFENIASLVGDRDPASTAENTEHALSELLQIDVKMAWGMPNLSYTNTAFDWTNRDPEEAGTLFGNDIAEGAMQYMLNNAIGALVAAINDDPATGTVVYDGTASTASPEALNQASGLFKDRRGAIKAWIMHSKSQTDIFGYALANSNELFDWAGVRVLTDGHGRPLIETDSDALVFDNAGTDNYIQLGLVSGAVMVHEQGDMRPYKDVDLKGVNAKTLLKAEGGFGIGVKGYTWNKSVVRPTSAQVRDTSNWSPIVGIGLKDTAGVKCITL